MNEELVDRNYSIKYICFKCLKTNHVYTVVGSKSEQTGIKDTIDTIVRDDGERKRVRREMLKRRFTNVEPISLFYEQPKASKRSKSKRR